MKHTAMITRASAGLGMEFARQIAAQGIDVVLVWWPVEKLICTNLPCSSEKPMACAWNVLSPILQTRMQHVTSPSVWTTMA